MTVAVDPSWGVGMDHVVDPGPGEIVRLTHDSVFFGDWALHGDHLVRSPDGATILHNGYRVFITGTVTSGD